MSASAASCSAQPNLYQTILMPLQHYRAPRDYSKGGSLEKSSRLNLSLHRLRSMDLSVRRFFFAVLSHRRQQEVIRQLCLEV